MSLRTLLVDDHRMMRTGLRLLIEQSGHIQVAGEASNGATALELARSLLPDLVVMDVHLPDANGIEVARQILSEFPLMKVIVLSADARMEWVDEALWAGVCAYLLKESAEDELAQAIEAILEGKLYLCPEINSLLLRNYRQSLQAKEPGNKQELSARERDVLRMIADGLRIKEIAVRLGVEPGTVETYRRRLVRKLGFSSNAELTRHAIRQGLVDL
jgi:DNA-binding NarL/FixJ family response regulator